MPLTRNYSGQPGRDPNSIGKPAFLWIVIFGVAAFVGLTIPILEWVGAVLFVTLFLVGVVFFDFRIGVVVLMILYPLSTARLLPSYAGINPLNLALVGTALSYLLHRYNHRVDYRLFDKNLFFLYLLPFFLAGLYGSTRSHELVMIGPALSDMAMTTRTGFLVSYLIKPTLMVVMGLLIAAAVRESKEPRLFLYPFAIASAIPPLFITAYTALSGVGLSQLVSFRSFFSVLGFHANQFAVVINFSIAILLFSAIAAQSTFVRVMLLIFVAFLSGAIALTFSRGGYLGFLVIVIAYFVYNRNWRGLFFGILVVGIAIPLVPDAIIDRITLGVTHGSRDEMSSGRLEGIWAPLLPKVLESPIIGHGALYVGRSELVISGRMQVVYQAHNAYLDLLLDMGLIGLVLVLTFYVTMYRRHKALSVADPDPLLRGFFRGASVGVLTVLVQALTDDRLVPNLPQMFMWMAYGFMLGRQPDMRQPAVGPDIMKPSPGVPPLSPQRGRGNDARLNRDDYPGTASRR